MRRVVLAMALLSLVSIIGLAFAEQAPKSGAAMGETMMMPKPGPESLALDKFFGTGCSWTGNVPAGAMGPDSKAMTSHGKMTCHPLFGGMWYSCDVEDAMGAGKQAMTWKGHVVVGYDMGTKTYHAMCMDNMGMMMTYNGMLDGDKFVLETPKEVMMMGQMMKDRLTWEMAGETMKFMDEHQVGGGDWTVAESAAIKRAKSGGMKGQSTAMKP